MGNEKEGSLLLQGSDVREPYLEQIAGASSGPHSRASSGAFRFTEQKRGTDSAVLVVDEHGAPHGVLTAFYEHLQHEAESNAAAALYLLFPFFCSLHAKHNNESWWDGPPKTVRRAIDAYLDCYGYVLVHGDYTVVFTNSIREVRHFLTVLTQFYCFAIQNNGYWYANPLGRPYSLRPLFLYPLFNWKHLLG